MMPIALFLAAAISAEPIDIKQTDYAEKVPFGEWKLAYPAGALKKGLAGKATVLCHPASTGWLIDCKVETEDPVGESFGQAMISMAQRNRLKPGVARSYGPSAWLRYRGSFSEADLYDSLADWLKQPTPGELNAVWPAKALRDGVSGRAVISCKAAISGALEQCSVKEESPVGLGFGNAALLLAPAFRMKPAMKDGKPIASSITVPIDFANRRAPAATATGSLLTAPIKGATILPGAPFDRVPSYADVVAAWPAGVSASMTDGKAAMRCRLRETGLIDDCSFTFVSSPRLERPARDLAKAFHVRLGDDVDRQDLARVYVSVPIQFISPARASPARRITHAVWVGALDEVAVAKLYPAEAARQGVKSGRGVVECTVGDDGGLVGCKTTSETPANLGFGRAALDIAAMMKMTLWGDDGLPTVGGTVSLPLVINQPEAQVAAK